MAEQSGEKSFDATPHRRQQARDKGQVAYSQDLGSAALLLVAAVLMKGFGPAVILFASKLMRQCLGEPVDLAVDDQMLVGMTRDVGQQLSIVMLPIFGFLMLAGALASVFQVGILFVPDKLAPDISRLSLFQGIKRIISPSGAAKLGFGLVKVIIVAIVSAAVLWTRGDEILNSTDLAVGDFCGMLAKISIDTLLWVGLALFLLALADFAFQKWKHEQDLKMTHQEVKEEMKNMQGDPEVAARRRQVQRQMALNRTGEAVPKADVVVTNPTELAIAIQYDPETMAAPIVVAKGAGVLAQRIRRLALENNIPVVERKPLARLLYKEVEINHPVPDASYAAVAEVLAYVYQLQGRPAPRAPGGVNPQQAA